MKKNLLTVVILLIGVAITINAQQKKELISVNPTNCTANNDSLQCQHMANLLMLDNATTEKFKSVYMDYLSEIAELRNTKKERCDSNKNCKEKELTDAEVEQTIEKRFEISQRFLNIEKKYYTEFKKILTLKQIACVYKTTPPSFSQSNRGMPLFDMQDERNCKNMPPMNAFDSFAMRRPDFNPDNGEDLP